MPLHYAPEIQRRDGDAEAELRARADGLDDLLALVPALAAAHARPGHAVVASAGAAHVERVQTVNAHRAELDALTTRALQRLHELQQALHRDRWAAVPWSLIRSSGATQGTLARYRGKGPLRS